MVVPKAYRSRALAGCHDNAGHQGRMRTLSLLRERFFWPGMQTEATQYLLKCTRCLRRRTPPQVAPLQPMYVTQPLELVHMDYLSLEPSKENIENVLVITDHFTRYALAYPSKIQIAQATTRILWGNFICHYGFPEKIISDQGRNFESDLIKELCKIAGVRNYILRLTIHKVMDNVGDSIQLCVICCEHCLKRKSQIGNPIYGV